MEIRSQPAFGATSRDVRYRTVRKRFAAVLVLLAASITGWSGAGGVRASTTGIHWIVAASALKEIAQLNPTVAQAAFDNPSTYVVRDGTGTGIRSGWTSIPTASANPAKYFVYRIEVLLSPEETYRAGERLCG